MDYLSENCYLSTLKDNNEMDLFHCGDADLDDFFHNDIERHNVTTHENHVF